VSRDTIWPICQACGGRGEAIYTERGDGEAYEATAVCGACGGDGTAAPLYATLAVAEATYLRLHEEHCAALIAAADLQRQRDAAWLDLSRWIQARRRATVEAGDP
jgi:hypothetical protein